MTSKSLWVAMLVGLVGVGCKASVVQVAGPDGKADWWEVSCPAVSLCYDKAAEVCPHGYELADRAVHTPTELVIRCRTEHP